MITNIILIALIYITGCVLSFGSICAYWYEIDEKNVETGGLMDLWTNRRGEIIVLVLLSWFGFYPTFFSKKKYYLKFSYKPLRDKQREFELSQNPIRNGV